MAAFMIDGVAYNVAVTSLKRKFSVLDGKNAGRTIDARMHRDILGTFYNYTLELDTKMLDRAQYDARSEGLSAPEDSHTVVFPYGQTTLSFEAYVTSGEDALVRMTGSGNYWKGLKVNLIAMAPQRT